MRLPAPKPGLVICYSFLWSDERGKGAVEGTKDRPCAIIVASPRDKDGHIRTVVAPVTHSPPIDPNTSIEIPGKVCRSLGLDEGRHWLRLDELNRFVWPGYDLRPRAGGRYDYGMLPPGLFETLRQAILDLQRRRGARIVGRDE